ncbi:MAG TPA: phosphatidylserine decarboxylase family protein [Gemmatimonadales bacterium]|nr:phosphatidylserine decarboxylase family protein [Gemmatimonadales bacterium]
MRIAPEGWPFIAIAWLLVAGAAYLGNRWGGPWWIAPALLAIFAIWVVAFFRDPIRPGPRGDRYVVSAAEGHVVHVTEIDEPMYLKERAIRISIFLSVFDVHVNRYPVSGKVELLHYNKGKFLHAAEEKASLDNEQSSIGMRGPHGPVLIRQIAGLIARRIVTDSKPGDQVEQGARLGLIRFGSRTDVFLPLSARPVVKVKPGDVVRVGGTVLAEYP